MSGSNVGSALSTGKVGVLLGSGGWSCHFRSAAEPSAAVRVKTVPWLLFRSASPQLKQSAPRVPLSLAIRQILRLFAERLCPKDLRCRGCLWIGVCAWHGLVYQQELLKSPCQLSLGYV